MIIQNRDGSILEEPRTPPLGRQRQVEDYYAAIPATLLDAEPSLIDRIVQLAFDKLNARKLTVRIYDADR